MRLKSSKVAFPLRIYQVLHLSENKRVGLLIEAGRINEVRTSDLVNYLRSEDFFDMITQAIERDAKPRVQIPMLMTILAERLRKEGRIDEPDKTNMCVYSYPPGDRVEPKRILYVDKSGKEFEQYLSLETSERPIALRCICDKGQWRTEVHTITQGESVSHEPSKWDELISKNRRVGPTGYLVLR